MDPSDHDKGDSGNGASGGHGATHGITHVNGGPPGDDGWLRSVLENSSEIVKILDPDGTLRYASPAFEWVLGHDPLESVGTMNVLEHVHPDDLPRVLAESEKALAEGRTVSNKAEYRFRHKDGSWRWVESVGTYLLDDAAVGGVVVTVRDITWRKEAEERLRLQAQLLGAVGEAVIALGADRKVVYWNPAAEEMYGFSSEETVSRRLMELVVPDELRAHAGEIMAGVGSGLSWKGEFVVRRKDGSPFTVEATSTPVFGQDGEQVGVIGVLRDVTERKQAEEALRRSEAELFSVLESITDGFFALDREWRFSYVNRQAETMLGRARDDLIGEKIWEDPTFYPHLRRAASENRTVEFEGYYPPLRKWYGVKAYPSESGLSVYFQDTTERKGAEERYRTLIERMPAVTYVEGVGGTRSTLYMSPQIEDMLGHPQEEWLNGIDHWKRCLHPEDRPRVLAENAHADETGEPFRTEYRMVHRDGRTVWVHDEAVLVEGLGGRRFWQGVITDIDDRKALEERLEHQALHDPLTGLPNRRLFADRLAHALEGTRRHEGRQVAVLFMDLDNFKDVNDSLGHEAGDLLLTLVAQRLRSCLRPEDTLARFGGDEFVVLLEDVETGEEAVRVAERISEVFESAFRLDGRELYARASIGIAVGDAPDKTPEYLLRDADTAMYRAKEAGGNYSTFDPAMYERAKGRLELENDLRRAVERGEFVVHYQPIVRLDDGEVCTVEVLVRWDHPERGLLNPEEFVPAAEESGLIVPMGAAVLEEACRQAKAWQEAHPQMPPLTMSVDLSVRQLARPDLAETVEDVLARTGFEDSSLGLDVTETVYVKALEGNTGSLDRLRALGVRISIDDFGTGYSSLAYLKRLPADAIKVDKSFIKGLGEDAEDTAIVGMVVELAHTLGLEAVAEGVETEGQAMLLREMGCELGQGFHFSRPLPPEDVLGFLRG